MTSGIVYELILIQVRGNVFSSTPPLGKILYDHFALDHPYVYDSVNTVYNTIVQSLPDWTVW